jgi:xylono-1,5-lactonase
MTLKVAVAVENGLGESAFWSVATQQIYWIDGVAATINCWDPLTHQHRVIELPSPPLGMIAQTEDPKILAIADGKGIALFDLDVHTRVQVADPEHGREGIAYNDGKVDPDGRLWVGSYDATEIEPRGCLWMFQNGQPARLADSGFRVENGPTFSLDGRVIYVSDSVGRRILAYDIRGNRMSARRLFVECTPEEGLPDGLTTDAEGCVWCAHWDGGRVTRFSPSGERLAVICLPVPRVTSVAFGGKNLNTLFITTARSGLSEAQLAIAPEAGALFAVNPGVTGIAATPLPLPFACC